MRAKNEENWPKIDKNCAKVALLLYISVLILLKFLRLVYWVQWPQIAPPPYLHPCSHTCILNMVNFDLQTSKTGLEFQTTHKGEFQHDLGWPSCRALPHIVIVFCLSLFCLCKNLYIWYRKYINLILLCRR